jgi:hypothetical protein
MQFDAQRVLINIRQAETDDLLDRVTVYREEMEPAAILMIESELARRGVYSEDIEEHGRERADRIVRRPDGTAQPCSFCHRPAVRQAWGWHRMWGKLPVFPRLFAYCEQHQPEEVAAEEEGPLWE